jgi:iron complex outermembrane receptor protein/vitamin B12 transporter
MPSFYQIWNPIRSYKATPNFNLKPEKGWTYDIGVKDGKAANPWSFGVFYMDMEDKINYQSDEFWENGQYVNLDQYRAWGIEAEMKFNFHENWSYTQGISMVPMPTKNRRDPTNGKIGLTQAGSKRKPQLREGALGS